MYLAGKQSIMGKIIQIESITSEELRGMIKEVLKECILEIMPKEEEKYLTTKELAEHPQINVTPQTIHDWKKNKNLPFHRFGKKPKYLLSEVLEWAKTNRVKITPNPASSRLPGRNQPSASKS